MPGRFVPSALRTISAAGGYYLPVAWLPGSLCPRQRIGCKVKSRRSRLCGYTPAPLARCEPRMAEIGSDASLALAGGGKPVFIFPPFNSFA